MAPQLQQLGHHPPLDPQTTALDLDLTTPSSLLRETHGSSVADRSRQRQLEEPSLHLDESARHKQKCLEGQTRLVCVGGGTLKRIPFEDKWAI